MSLPRFFVDPALPLHPGTTITLPPDVAHQAGHVLRLRPGDRIVLLDNSGEEALVELTHFARSGIAGQVLSRTAAPGEGGPAIVLYQCVLKGERFTWVLQKATEIGVAAIVPVVSERTIPPLTEVQAPGKQERWQRIVREAAEQSRRGRLPPLRPAVPWAAALASVAAGEPACVPWEEADAGAGGLGPLRVRVREAGRLHLFIGPEGGLTPAEVAAARAVGVVPVTLGPRILRAETAALAALAVLLVE